MSHSVKQHEVARETVRKALWEAVWRWFRRAANGSNEGLAGSGWRLENVAYPRAPEGVGHFVLSFERRNRPPLAAPPHWMHLRAYCVDKPPHGRAEAGVRRIVTDLRAPAPLPLQLAEV